MSEPAGLKQPLADKLYSAGLVDASLVRKLERELAQAHAEIKRLEAIILELRGIVPP